MARNKIPGRRIRDYLRWEAYKNFFHIAFLRYLVVWFSLVPLLVSLLRGLPRPLVIPVGSGKITVALEMPFSWQTLWISSLFFFLALAIYHCRCPGFIKKYNNYSEYCVYGHDPRWLVWEARDLVREGQGVDSFVKRLETKGFLKEDENDYTGDLNPVVDKDQTKLYFQHATKNYVFALPPINASEEKIADVERGVFWELFARYSGSRLISRIIIFLLLICSGVTFLIVLVQHIWAGLVEVCPSVKNVLISLTTWVSGLW